MLSDVFGDNCRSMRTDQVSTVGVYMSGCTPPGTNKPANVGAVGEIGSSRLATQPTVAHAATVASMRLRTATPRTR